MENSQIDLERLINLKDNSDCLAICFNKQEDTIFFATNGKYIYKTDLLGKNMSLLTTINEVDRGWDDEHDNTFLQDFTFANDGYIYAAARNCIIRVDPHSGDYDSVIGDKFSGPWGAYGITSDKNSNLYIGDHDSGILFFNKANNWDMMRIVSKHDVLNEKSSFGGLRISNNNRKLYFMDFENSTLFSCDLKYNKEIPIIGSIEKLELNMNFPEFLNVYNDELFITAAREKDMARVKQNKIIQKFSFSDKVESASFVTFLIKEVDDILYFYGVDWGPNGGLFRAKLNN